MKRWTWGYLAVAPTLGSGFALSGGNPFLVALINLAAIVVIVAGIRIHRLPAWTCWAPLAFAVGAWTGVMLWLAYLPPLRDPAAIPPLLALLFGLADAVMAFGIFWLLRRQRETVAAPLMDVAMLTILAWLLVTEFGFGTYLIPDLIVVALSFRLLIGSRQPPAGWLLLGGVTAAAVAQLVFAARIEGAAALPRGLAEAGWILATAAIAASALHPSSVELMRRRQDRRWNPYLTPVLVVAPVTAVAAVVVLHPGHGSSSLTETHILQVALGVSLLFLLAFARVVLALRRYEAMAHERQEEEAKFRALVEQLPVATYIGTLGESWELLYVSEQIVDLTGFLPQEFLDDPQLWSGQISEPYREQVREATQLHRSSGQPLSLEYPFQTRDRRTIWIGHRARIVRTEEGRPLYTEGVVFDITDAKERERPAWRKMRMLNAVFESAPVGVVTVAAGGRVVSANPALEEMLGYTIAELESLSLRDVLAPAMVPELERRLRETMRGSEQPHQIELELIRKDGEKIAVSVTVLRVRTEEVDDAPLLSIIVEDITERERSREELKRTAEQLQTVISNLPIIVFTLDSEQRMQMLEGRAANAHGSDLTELVGVQASDFLADVPGAFEAVQKAYSGEPQHITADFPAYGGWWEIWYSPLRDRDGVINGVLGLAHNVSERVTEQRTLERSLSLLNTTFDSIADGVVATDLEGQPVTYNKRFVSMWDVPVEVWESWDSDRRREHVFEQIKGDARERAGQVENDVSSEVVDEIELRNGRLFETHVNPQRVNNEVVGRVVTFRDVTEERRWRALLQDEARILEAIARDAPSADILDDICRTVATYSPESLCSVLLVDEALNALVAQASPGLGGFYELYGPMPITPENGSCGRAASSGQPVIVEDVQSDPLFDGYRDEIARYGMRSCWSFPITSAAGKVLGTFAVYQREPRPPTSDELRMIEVWSHLAAVALERDQAARRREALEDRLRQAEKMESAGRLARGFAHDLGNVLTAIGLNSDLLHDEVSSPRAEEALRDLETATMMASHLVNDLLNLMRPAYPELVDVNRVVGEMSSLLRKVVKERIALEIRLDPSEQNAEVDVTQLQQVVLNLVMNANEAIPEAGVITITTAADAEADSVILTVEDDGVGMDVETQEQAFEPFFTTKRHGGAKGVGLGLASASSALARVGAHMTIESEVGRGTVVRVHLPQAKAHGADAESGLVPTAGRER